MTETGTKITEESLRAAGYNEFPPGALKPSARKGFQRKMRHGLYVNIYSYEPYGPCTEIGFVSEGHLNNDACTMDFTLHLPNHLEVAAGDANRSIEWVEEFFRWQAEHFEARFGPLES